MASQSFNRKTWKGRLGTDLDLYTIGPKDTNGRQKIEPYTGGVTEVGDALSAGNFNNLEGRIDSAFESTEGLISSEATTRQSADEALDAEITKIKNGTTTVEKAKKDEDGNNIKSTYATKTELSDEESARQTADANEQNARIAKDNDLQSQIVKHTSILSNHNKRLRNLEHKSGDYEEMIYPDEDYSMNGIPEGVEEYAIVSKLRGVTVAWDQLLQNNATKLNTNGVSFTANGDGTISVTGTPTARAYSYSDNPARIPMQAGHVIFLFVELLSGTIPTGVEFGWSAYNGETYLAGRGLTDRYQLVKMPANTTDLVALLTDITATAVASLAGGSVNFKAASRAYDLTQMFGPSVANYLYSIEQATTGAGVALFKALVKAQDNSHETGRLVSTTYEAVKSVGVNLFDGQLEEGEYNATTGEKTPSTSYLRNVNLIPVLPNTTYYLKSPLAFSVYYFDINKQKIGTGAPTLTKDHNFTTDASAYFMAFAFNKASYGGLPFKNDIQICLDSYTGKANFHEYMTDNLTLPTPVTLRGLLKVVSNNLVVDGDEYEPKSGAVTRKYVQTVLGTGWAYHNGVFRKTFSDRASEGFRCPKYPNGSSVTRDDDTIWFEYLVSPKDIVIRDDSYNGDVSAFEADNKNVPLLYAIAIPTPDTPVTPVLDPTLATEGGGTLSTTQTNDPAIVSAMDIGYMYQ